MLTVTFYSFRGGVGRTMALANVAAHFAHEGLKVFLIDFDLEAPGLSLMPELQPVEAPASNEGLIGYLRTGLEDRDLPPVNSLSYETRLFQEIREGSKHAESIHLLPAGTTRSPNRGQALAHLHLEDLYKSKERSLVIDALKVQIEEQYQPDYLLVDSRTGLTDVGGICTVHLADLLVIVTGLNRQNVDGTSMVVRNLSAARTDFSANVLFAISPVPIGEETLKAERLAAAAKEFAVAMGTEEDLSSKLLTVPYHPQVALTEDCFVTHHPNSPLAQAYLAIADAIRDRNPYDFHRLWARTMDRFENGDPQAIADLLEMGERSGVPGYARSMAATLYYLSEDYESAKALVKQLASEDLKDFFAKRLWGDILSAQAQAKQGAEADGLFDLAGQKYAAALEIKPDQHEALNNWGNALLAQARTKQGAEADGLFDLAGQKYAAALEIKPDQHEALYNWGNALLAQAQTKQGAEADGLFDLAGQKYAAALEIKPDQHEALYNWGSALSDQAQTKQGAEADGLFDLAGQKYAAALEIKPDKHEALYNWGTALTDQAKTEQGAEADGLFDLAGQKYAAALEIKPDQHEALNNWGNALSAQAQTKQGAEADGLFDLAGQKYAAALEIKPDKHEALNNWGTALLDQAKTKRGAEADALLDLAGQKYAAALEIKPDFHEALNNWGTALLGQAKTKQGAEADRLFDLASEKSKKANQLCEGRGAYNLACIAALRGNSDECLDWLENSRATGTLPTGSHLDADTDLDRVRDEPWFRDFVQSLDDV